MADTRFTMRSPGVAVVGPNGHSAVSPAQLRMADCHPGQCARSRWFRARDPSSWRVCTDMEANALPLSLRGPRVSRPSRRLRDQGGESVGRARSSDQTAREPRGLI